MQNQIETSDSNAIVTLLKMQQLKLINDMLGTLNDDEAKVIFRNLLLEFINKNSHLLSNLIEEQFRRVVTQKTNDALVDWTPVLDETVQQMIDGKIASYIERGFQENQKWQTQKKKGDDFLKEISKKIDTYMNEQRWSQ